ncbi:MAG: T9SS type A sorting domain-containing protein [Bacteroidales bacterium]|nr:T9SS type A sorting domain-containing protein [Bacteroidales bacterium]
MMKVTTFGKSILVNGAEYTVTYTTTPLPKHTITWSMPDSTNTTQVTEGSAIGTLPADPSAPSGCSDKVFVGWTATNIGATPTNNKPDFITANTVPAGNTTYYAVFATKSGSGAGEEYEWTTYSDWGIKQTSWLRNNNAMLPTLSYTPTYKVEKIVLNVKQSNNKGSNSIEVRIGGETFGSKVASLSGTAAYDITFQGLEAETGKIEIICTNTSGSGTGKGTFYLNSITLYEEGVSYSSYITECIDCTAPTEALALTLSQETTNLGQDGNAVVTFSTTGGNGTAVTYAVTPTTGATLNGTTVTFTQEGTYTLTASQTYTTTNGTTYCGGTDSKKIVITKTPVLYFPTTPADPIKFGTVECGGNTPLTDKQTISLRGYNLTSDVTVTVTGDYKIADTESAELADYATSLTLPKDAVSGSSASVYVISTPPMQSSSPTTGKVTFATAGGNTLEVNLSTPDITCTEYTLTLKDRGTTISEENYLAGASVPKPADPTGVCTEPINYIFDGWATAEVAEGSTTYTKVSFPYTMPAANTTLYAVYKYEGNTISDTQFGRGTLDDLVDGQKVVIVEQDAKKALNSKTYQSYYLTATAVTINNDLIDVTNNALIWELKKNGSNYSFLQDGKYLNITESSTHYNLTVTSQEDSWSIVAFGDGYSLQSTTYADYYAVYNSKYTEYTTDKTAYALQFYVPVAIQEYTTAPSCTPCIKGTDDITVTSAQGIWVEAVTPLNITATNLDKNADGANVTITATSLTGGFTLKTQGINGSGSESVTLETDYSNSIYNANLMVVYSPTADNIIEEGKIALRVYRTNGTTTYATDTIIVRGRSLPAEFVLAAETTNGWVALPADLGTSSTDAVKEPYTISVDDNAAPTKATLAPQSALYSAAMRSTVNAIPTGLRFKAGGKYLQGSQSKGETKVWLSSTDSEQMQSWELHSSNLIDYFVRLRAAEEGRYLSYNATQGKIANYKQESRLRILPVENTCVRFDAPNINVHALISTSVTFVWEAIAGVTDYEYSLDGEKTWQTCSDIETLGTEVKWTLANLKSETKYTVYIRAKVADGKSNCSASDSETFTTPTCDDVPVDLWVSPTANAATIMWSAKAPTATVKIYADEQGTTLVKETLNATTPCKIIGLEQNTDYYYQVLAGGSCASAIAHFKTESNEVSIVEWKKDAVIVDLNTEVTDADEVSILVEGQKTHGGNTKNVANDLFFSKYFEAKASLKLIAIFNGTKDAISLADTRVVFSKGEKWVSSNEILDLAPLNSIPANTEYIFFSYTSTAPTTEGPAVKCIKESIGFNHSTWFPTNKFTADDLGVSLPFSSSLSLNISGDRSMALQRKVDGVWKFIDLFGAGNETTADNSKCKEVKDQIEVTLEDGSITTTKMNDAPGWYCANGIHYVTDATIPLSTNRYLLIRKNSVKDGLDAVKGDTTDFTTLCSEWEGAPCGKFEDSEADNTTTCVNFAYVSDFNYNDYYTTYDSIANLEIKGNRNEDGTYTIPIPKLDTMACTNLRLQLKKKGTIQATREEKVPIIIYKTTDTKNSEFFGEKLTDEVCATCDVVVRDNAQLSHIAGGKQKFRDMYVYTGSSLNIPENQTMSLDKVRMFATNDNVSYAVINNSNDAAAAISVKEVSHVKRIDGRYWYPFSLPYDCNIADIVQLNGQPLGVYGTDWGIKYYNGYERQKDGNSTTHYGEVSKYWKMMPEDGQLKAYTGYIIGLFVPAADEPLMKSVNFPPATESAYTENADSKTTPITNWSVNLSAKPRHHGWNFVGSPYISLFGSNNNTLGEGLYNTQVQMGWTDALGNQRGKDHIYVSIPNGGNTNTYTQSQASGVTIKPFTAYFVQAIDPTNNQSNTLSLTYSKANRHLLASPARAAADASPLILAELDIRCGALHDNTGVLVSDDYSVDYEIGDDLYKMYAAAAKPQLYTTDASSEKMAYQALPDPAAHAVPLGIYLPAAGDYTLSLNRSVSRVASAEAVCLLHDGKVVADLLQTDYTLTAAARGTLSGYTLDIRRAPKMPTDILPAAGDAPYLIARDGVLTVANLPAGAMVQVYDVLGRVLLRTTATEQSLSVPAAQTGVYTVLITTDNLQTVLKTLLR